MSILLVLAALNIAGGIFDAHMTLRRIRKYGPSVELNPVIRVATKVCGPELAILAGEFIPCVAQSVVCVLLGWQVVLALIVGFRIKLTIQQLQSFSTENELDTIKTQLAIECARLASSAAPCTAPPSEASGTETAVDLPEPPLPFNSIEPPEKASNANAK